MSVVNFVGWEKSSARISSTSAAPLEGSVPVSPPWLTAMLSSILRPVGGLALVPSRRRDPPLVLGRLPPVEDLRDAQTVLLLDDDHLATGDRRAVDQQID